MQSRQSDDSTNGLSDFYTFDSWGDQSGALYTNRYYSNGFGGNYYRDNRNDSNGGYELITESSDLPIKVSDVLTHLKIDEDQSEEAGYYQLLVRAAILNAEELSRHEIIERTYRAYMDNLPYGPFKIYKTPIKSISSVSYYNTDNQLTVIDGTNYYLTYSNVYPRLLFNYNYSIPNVYTRAQGAFIEFTAGGLLKEDLKLAILHHIAVMHEQRGDWGSADVYSGQLIGALPAVSRLIYSNYRSRVMNQ